jgi:hypothetical protein
MRTLTVAALSCLFFGVALRADQPIEVPWNDVCHVTSGKEINLHTATGDDVKGYCLTVNVDEMSVRTTDGRIVKIARTALQKLRMSNVRSGQLKSLGRGVHEAFWGSVGMLFSPAAPIGLVGVPASLAWGAVAAPFCALNDLHAAIHGKREIKVM